MNAPEDKPPFWVVFAFWTALAIIALGFLDIVAGGLWNLIGGAR